MDALLFSNFPLKFFAIVIQKNNIKLNTKLNDEKTFKINNSLLSINLIKFIFLNFFELILFMKVFKFCFRYWKIYLNKIITN